VIDRVEAVRQNLDRCLAETPPASQRLGRDDPLREGSGLRAGDAVALFEDQVRSREVDIAARDLRRRDLGYYTISSAGHEQNAVIGALLRLTDPCLLHYRSGGLFMARARKQPGADPVLDTLLGVAASRDDPISEGRHKVWGSRELWIPPQTSTIASHLPKAVGLAFAIERARRLGLHGELPADAVVCCSFGDASVNHASALAALNAARWSHRVGSPIPILLVCEDNGWGISVATPRRWIEETFGSVPHLRYVPARGEVDEIWDAVSTAVDMCRSGRVPVFLHLETVRLWGHAGSDAEIGYRSLDEIRADEGRDPLVMNARRLIVTGAASPDELRSVVADVREAVGKAADEAATRERLRSRDEIIAPLVSHNPKAVRREARGKPRQRDRRRHIAGPLPEEQEAPLRRTLAAHIGSALHDEMLRRPEILVFGEDVARKGGVYHVTAGLQERFGPGRVFDTLLDETTILGLAQGTALAGFLPVPEIQYLAYVHNALDQIRGEAGSLAFFSAGQFTNPMVVRIAAFAYQKGFGGHFHNDNSVGALRDIPGIVLAVPSRGDDAARMLRGSIAVTKVTGRIVCLLEPIALYHERDLYEEGDDGWLTDYPSPGSALLPGEPGVHRDEDADVLVVTYANGVRMALRAARRLEREHGVRTRVLDLRWLSPLPLDAVRRHAEECGRVVVADEARATAGGVADAVVAALAEAGFRGPLASVRSADSYVPLGPAADAVLLGEEDIVEAVRSVV
jgi:2-oxoisovalerate dehydrogenase E1 component